MKKVNIYRKEVEQFDPTRIPSRKGERFAKLINLTESVLGMMDVEIKNHINWPVLKELYEKHKYPGYTGRWVNMTTDKGKMNLESSGIYVRRKAFDKWVQKHWHTILKDGPPPAMAV